MKWFLVGLMSLFLTAWFFNYPVLSGMYDLDSCSQQYKFWITRSVVYEFMFLCLAGVCFFTGSGLTRAFAWFACIMIVGSLIDKIVFKISDYMYGDIVLVILGLVTSYIVWKRSKMN